MAVRDSSRCVSSEEQWGVRCPRIQARPGDPTMQAASRRRSLSNAVTLARSLGTGPSRRHPRAPAALTTAATIGRPCRRYRDAPAHGSAARAGADGPPARHTRQNATISPCGRNHTSACGVVGCCLPRIYVRGLVSVSRPRRDFYHGLTASRQSTRTKPAGGGDACPSIPGQRCPGGQPAFREDHHGRHV